MFKLICKQALVVHKKIYLNILPVCAVSINQIRCQFNVLISTHKCAHPTSVVIILYCLRDAHRSKHVYIVAPLLVETNAHMLHIHMINVSLKTTPHNVRGSDYRRVDGGFVWFFVVMDSCNGFFGFTTETTSLVRVLSFFVGLFDAIFK